MSNLLPDCFTSCNPCSLSLSFKILIVFSLMTCIFRHEIVGLVTEIGSNVERFKVGDRVGAGTYVNSCRNCDYCNEHLEVHCSKGATFTFNGLDSDGTITKGGYSSHFVVHQRQV